MAINRTARGIRWASLAKGAHTGLLPDISSLDHDSTGGFPAGKPIRLNNKMADEVRSAVHIAENKMHFALDEPAPGVRVLRVAGELDLLTMPLLDHHL